MPSPRAVLCDISDLGLDPRKAHKKTTAGGRLSTRSVLARVTSVKKPSVKQPVTPVLVELPVEPVVEPVIEPVKVEPEVDQVTVAEISAVEVEAPKKKPGFKKKDKAEESGVS